MTPDEEIILAAWAAGAAGISARLAKRAWSVLKDRRDRPRDGLGQAWGNVADVHKWLQRYADMGLVGLVDEPRGGRPKTYEAQIEAAADNIAKLSASSFSKTRAGRQGLLAAFSRQEKEAIWRHLRKSGIAAARQRNGVDVPLPDGNIASDLASVLLMPHMVILTFMRHDEANLSPSEGSWVGVPAQKLIIPPTAGVGNEKSLIGAMSLDVRTPKSNKSGKGNSIDANQKRNRYLLHRTLARIDELALIQPKSLRVTLIVNLTDLSDLVEVLGFFRANKLWKDQGRRAVGRLKDLAILPFTTSSATAIQSTIAANLQDTSSDELSKLQHALTLKRKSSFCWLRSIADATPQKISNWLLRDGA